MTPIKGINESITPLRAVDLYKNDTQIAYFISDNSPHILVCISNGNKRDNLSCKPTMPLYGFMDPTRPTREPHFVRHTKVEAVIAAMNGPSGSTLGLFNSIQEVLSHRV